MIHQLSLKVTDYFFSRKIFTVDSYDVYTYGFEMILSILIGFTSIFICGILSHSLIRALLYYFIFVTIRTFSGGYHADTHIMCKSVFCGTFLLDILLENLLISKYNLTIHLVIVSINIISSILLAPVESKNKPISENIKKRNRTISIIIYIIISIITIFLLPISIKWAMFITLVMTNTSLLMYIGILKERRHKHE